METVVLRLVGAATLVGQRQQTGEAKINACVGGYGPLVATASKAARLILQNRPARIPAGWEGVVRRVVAMRALAGQGPDGQGVNWSGDSAA